MTVPFDTSIGRMLEWITGVQSEPHQQQALRPVLTLVLAGLLPLVGGCAVRRTRRALPAAVPPPVAVSAGDLIARINAQSKAVRTLTATVRLEPVVGSAYSGVIKEYHDVKAFILLDAPDKLRMIGQAPVVRTTLFDMVSDGQSFKLSIPPRQKFIVGTADVERPARNAFENFRPQHLLEALLLDAVDPARDYYYMEQRPEGGRYYDVVGILRSEQGNRLGLKRTVWFNATTLEIERVELYGPRGAVVEDVKYSDDRDFQGVHYPAHIEVSRPQEDYSLGIVIEKATFNQPIAADRFQLVKPPGEQLIDISSPAKEGGG